MQIEKKRGILNSIRYFLAPKDLFENIKKLEQELMQLKVAKGTESRITHQLLEDKERAIKEKEFFISELKKELAEIKINAPAKLEAERRKRQSENVHTILSPKQLELFKLLSQGEKSYAELLETAHSNKLDIHDMPSLRVQISRLNKKLQQATNYKIERVQRNDVFYYKVS